MTAIISAIPILLLIVLMMGFKVSGYRSAIATLVVTIVLALFAVPAMGNMPEKYAEASIYGVTLWSVIEGLLKSLRAWSVYGLIIFFILNQSFAEEHEVARYAKMMRDVAKLVVEEYGGSLKAEHGTGPTRASRI